LLLIVCRNGRTERVRLLGINAPERGTPGALEATAALRRLIGDLVELRPDGVDKLKRDRWGRLLAWVFRDGRNASED